MSIGSAPRTASVDDMDDENDDESILIGPALRRLEAEMALPRKDLVRLLGVSYSHFSNLVTDQRGAGLPTIRKIAKRSGRAMGFFFGDIAALAIVGTLTQSGAVNMLSEEPTLPALIRVDEEVGPFKAGDLLHVRAAEWEDGRWLLLLEDGEAFIASAADHAGLRIYRTLTGRTGFVDDQSSVRVVGVIENVTTSPPPPPAPVLLSAEKRR